jgi:hypothetical protein
LVEVAAELVETVDPVQVLHMVRVVVSVLHLQSPETLETTEAEDHLLIVLLLVHLMVVGSLRQLTVPRHFLPHTTVLIIPEVVVEELLEVELSMLVPVDLVL